jgi:hypothetical protein
MVVDAQRLPNDALLARSANLPAQELADAVLDDRALVVARLT